MPQFHLTDQELSDLADFLELISRINTQGWPPNDGGLRETLQEPA